ncbi:MAG UNVERIFIED_CONTAM: hypothetical protein LVT10_21275 [Anaerolineae bacterium]
MVKEAHRSDQVIVSEVLGKLVRDNIPPSFGRNGRVPVGGAREWAELQAELTRN